VGAAAEPLKSRLHPADTYSRTFSGVRRAPIPMSKTMSPSVERRVLLGFAATWIGLIAVGMGMLARYSLTPGREGRPPAVWPASSRLERPLDRYTLVVVAHPHCPCTRATLGELAIVMARCQGRITARVLFVQPRGFTEQWTKSGLWPLAENIPETTPVLDEAGLEAGRFAAYTSGQGALYDPEGRLVFRGGMTGARGHEGANAGREAIVALVRNRSPGVTAQTPVFGCPLEGPGLKKAQHLGNEGHRCPNS